MDWLTDPDVWISLLTLTLLEIVLGIDNLIFISILSGKLPPEQQAKARKVGILIEEPYFSADGGKFLNRQAGVRPVVQAASCDAPTAGSYLQHFDAVMAAIAGGQ